MCACAFVRMKPVAGVKAEQRYARVHRDTKVERKREQHPFGFSIFAYPQQINFVDAILPCFRVHDFGYLDLLQRTSSLVDIVYCNGHRSGGLRCNGTKCAHHATISLSEE